MKDNLDSELKKLVAAERKYGDTGPSNTLTDADIPDFTHEQKITMFGHTFTMAELDAISRFASQLEMASNSVLNQKQILDGAIFIIKIMNKETQVSFGGISKK